MEKINIHLKSLKFLVVEKVVALNIKVEHCFFFQILTVNKVQ